MVYLISTDYYSLLGPSRFNYWTKENHKNSTRNGLDFTLYEKCCLIREYVYIHSPNISRHVTH